MTHSCNTAELSLVIVTYNSSDEIEDLIESIDRQQLSLIVWIVDNNSSDDTLLIARGLSERHPWIKLIPNNKNIGLAAANNIPLELINTPFTAFVNPDIVLHPNSLSSLKSYIEQHSDAVAVAPINVYENGRPHTSFHRNWTLLHLLIWRLLPIKLTHLIYRAIRTYDEQNVLFASGSCILMRTNDLKAIGGYDPMYFLSVEDVCDLCIRLRQGDKAKRVVVTNSAKVTHLVSRSGSRVPYIVLSEGAFGSIYHFTKHGGRLSGEIAYLIQLSSAILRLITSRIQSLRSSAYCESYVSNGKLLKVLLLRNHLSKSWKN